MAMNLAKMRLGSDRSHVCDLWLRTLPDRPLFPPIDCDESTLDAIRDDVVRMEALHIRADLILSYHVRLVLFRFSLPILLCHDMREVLVSSWN